MHTACPWNSIAHGRLQTCCYDLTAVVPLSSAITEGGTWASGHLILDLRQVVKADVIMGTVIGLLRYLGTRGADRSPRG